jgi:hypothetical protein
MYEVECTIDSKYSFVTQFYVHLTPSKPIKWKILLSPEAKNGIQCQAGDFCSKVLGVWLVDDAGNDAPGDYIPRVSPTLSISWTNDNTLPTRDSLQAQQINLILEEFDQPIINEEMTSSTSSALKSNKIRKYIPDPETILRCDRSLPVPFWLWVSDETESYQPSSETLTIIASYPSKLLFRCVSIFGENSVPIPHLETIPFINISKLSDLEILFVDENHQEASLVNLQDLSLRITTLITSEILNLEIETKEIILFQKKNFKNKLTNISINFQRITEVIEQYRPMVHDETLELIVSCSYLLPSGTKVHIQPPSLLMCRYLLLNLVTQLNPSYRVIQVSEGNLSSSLSMDSFYNQPPVAAPQNLSLLSIENAIQCGNKSKINLCLQTEDRQLVEVQVNDIQMKISYQDQDGNERTDEDLIDVENMKATFYVDYTTQTNVSYLVPALTKTGKYIFHFCYHENRPKILTNKFIPQSVLKVSRLTLPCLTTSIPSLVWLPVSLSVKPIW